MKLRILQVLFVALSLLFALLVVRRGEPHLLPATQAQGNYAGHAPEARPVDRQAAIAVIQAQLSALRKEDFQSAMRYQSQLLKHHFPSVSTFRQMMRAEYPAFLHARSAEFGVARTPDRGDHVFVPVTLEQGDGPATRALYMMVREGGAYRVDRVDGGLGPDLAPGGGPPPTGINTDRPGRLT